MFAESNALLRLASERETVSRVADGELELTAPEKAPLAGGIQ